MSFEDIWQVEFNNISFTSGKSLYIKSYEFKNAIYCIKKTVNEE